MNKSIATNLLAAFFIVIGLTTHFSYSHAIFIIGLFALSGAFTNYLAIHMLFEKVPFLYGSGVIENRFAEFKYEIYRLLMHEFFTKENLEKFFKEEIENDHAYFDFSAILNNTDFTLAYDSLKSVVMESSFGDMLAMFGGEGALTPLKEPFTLKLKNAIKQIVHTKAFQDTLKKNIDNTHISDDIYNKIGEIVNARLDELTPKMVKEIIQKMIKKHLGWLVIWGGVFGGLIGFISTFVL